MKKLTFRKALLPFALFGIVVMGQGCAKDMTTQDYDSELAAENLAKIQAHAGTYRGALKNGSGQTIAAMTIIVTPETVSPGANNNAGQNVGFGGTVIVTPQGSQDLRLGYTGAYYDFSDSANYRYNTKVMMPDGVNSDTIEVGGQFSGDTMNGTMYANNFPDQQYTTSFSLLRDGPTPDASSLISTQRSGISVLEGAATASYTGTSDAASGSIPMLMVITSNLTSTQAFYSFVSPYMEITVALKFRPSNPEAEFGIFNNIQFDQIHNEISGSIGGTSQIACTENSANGWDCTYTAGNNPIKISFTPSSN